MTSAGQPWTSIPEAVEKEFLIWPAKLYANGGKAAPGVVGSVAVGVSVEELRARMVKCVSVLKAEGLIAGDGYDVEGAFAGLEGGGAAAGGAEEGAAAAAGAGEAEDAAAEGVEGEGASEGGGDGGSGEGGSLEEEKS
jgi:hypothetical protein